MYIFFPVLLDCTWYYYISGYTSQLYEIIFKNLGWTNSRNEQTNEKKSYVEAAAPPKNIGIFRFTYLKKTVLLISFNCSNKKLSERSVTL